MNKISPSTTISLISLIVSILALVITLAIRFPRENLGFDYLGLIIGILALLTTILIGWQILDKIYLEKRMKEMALDIFKKEEEEITTESYYIMLSIYLTSFICYLKTREWYKVIIILKSMIFPIKELKETNHAEKLAKHTSELFKSWKEFSADERRLFISYMKEVKEILTLSPKLMSVYIDICSELKSLDINIDS